MNPNSNKTNEEVEQYAQSRIKMYAERFAAYSDDELRETIDRESRCRGCGSERSYYLYALRAECRRRGVTSESGSKRLASSVVFVED